MDNSSFCIPNILQSAPEYLEITYILDARIERFRFEISFDTPDYHFEPLINYFYSLNNGPLAVLLALIYNVDRQTGKTLNGQHVLGMLLLFGRISRLKIGYEPVPSVDYFFSSTGVREISGAGRFLIRLKF